VTIDEAALVLIAARVLDLDPAAVLAGSDIASLAAVAAACERVVEPVERAAIVAVEITRRRPFAAGNRAVAWLAAVHALAEADLVLTADAAQRAAVAAEVTVGTLDAGAVAAALAAHVRRRPGRARRAIGLLGRRTADRRLVDPWPCPVCGRILQITSAEAVGIRGPHWPPARFELASRCRTQHGVHGPDGRPLAPRVRPTVPGLSPVVRGGGTDLLTFVPAGALLVRRSREGYELAIVDDVDPGDLVGPWSRLSGVARPLGRVADAHVHLDEATGMLDMARLITGCNDETRAQLGLPAADLAAA
jgi:hypothetical protein